MSEGMSCMESQSSAGLHLNSRAGALGTGYGTGGRWQWGGRSSDCPAVSSAIGWWGGGQGKGAYVRISSGPPAGWQGDKLHSFHRNLDLLNCASEKKKEKMHLKKKCAY